ncbi:transporter [Clostridium tetani]|uniref:Transporter n=1 Tax=Clostridium tetani (strain Massachusetts / E88) TaxID=212717 RepID=Q899J8_CLOTE|nr:transporter [Clostridium tetani]AAO34828.1 transporter [Clostridium tetani E88]AVP55928.1 transporter [Clostridium tetani]KGI38798.1 transporter [Clostridium tetani ATCC 9441]KGI40671.1 transporter [Clostridium tetani]KGI46380.1 transporter [Clostridium tetani]
MFKNFIMYFKIAAVFVGTIVGAGLASGQEITQFFATYGYKSFFGLIICLIFYIFSSYIIISISIKYNLNSYKDLIILVSPGFLGKVTNIITGLFLISSSAIILAGSGALISQYFNLSKWVGICTMCLLSLIALLRDTKGLFEINSFIVPSLIFVISTIFILYLAFYENFNLVHVKSIPYYKTTWITSSILYSSFNILSSSGVMVPLSNEIKNKKLLFKSILLGSIILTFLSCIINLLLILNIPNIFKYEVPLLYVANRFGTLIQIMLLCIIWLEMFSTEVSNIYSISKTLEQTFNIPYRKCCILILLLAIPISQLGFVNLITFLYPSFGLIGLIFLIQCILFHFKYIKR